MISAIEGINLSKMSTFEREIFHQRCEIFAKKLGWKVKAENGLEIDQFDGKGTLYLASCDAVNGEVYGSLRLIPTNQPHMMCEQFALMFPDLAAVRSPLVWECTKFCAYKERTDTREYGDLHLTVGKELLVGMVEVALSAGITQILGMFEKKMCNLYNRAGIYPEILAETAFDGQQLMVGLMTISPETLQEMRDKAKLNVSVLDHGKSSIHDFEEPPVRKAG